MEDDEEIRSHTDSPDSPPPGRITVTVASTGPSPDALALALLPVHTCGGGRSGGREDCWSEKATGVLIDAWGERYLELSRGNLKQKHWKEVAEIVSSKEEDYGKTPKTDVQCKNRIDTVKKKYKQEKARIANGGGGSRWVFYDKLDRLIGSTAKIGTPVGLHKIPMGIPVTNLYNQQAKAVTTPPFSNNNNRLIGATARVSATSFGGSAGVGVGGGGGGNVPMGIPMSNRFAEQRGRMMPQQQQQGSSGMMMKTCSETKRWQFKKRNNSDSDSESEAAMSDDDSGDSLPPPPLHKRLKTEEKKKKQQVDGGGNKWRELTRAIVRFGEAYEQTENAKLQQVIQMEKERMHFFKDLELQRMNFFVKTQLEISQIKQHGRRIENSSNDHHTSKNNNMNGDVSN